MVSDWELSPKVKRILLVGMIPFPFIWATKHELLKFKKTSWRAATWMSLVGAGLYSTIIEKQVQRYDDYRTGVQNEFTYGSYCTICVATPIIVFGLFPLWNMLGRTVDTFSICFTTS
jgi:hypothetical protein